MEEHRRGSSVELFAVVSYVSDNIASNKCPPKETYRMVHNCNTNIHLYNEVCLGVKHQGHRF